MSGGQLYDTIGATYTVTRRTEPRIAAQVWAALGDARTVLNVGAGTGSLRAPGRDVIAVEPSALMRAPRPRGAAPVRGCRRGAPSVRGPVLRRRDGFCHRPSLAGPDRGPARDAARRSPRSGVHATTPVMPGGVAGSGLTRDYLPEVADLLVGRPSLTELAERDRSPDWSRCSIPWDCADGFFEAYWRRPEAYLDDQCTSRSIGVGQSRAGRRAAGSARPP